MFNPVRDAASWNRRVRLSRAVPRSFCVVAITAVGVVAVDGSATAAPTPVVSAPAVQTVLGLSQGSKGDGVRQLQRALIDAGITVRGGADGVFGPATRAALVEFQRARSLSTSGQVDQVTAQALSGSGSSGGTPTATTPGQYVGLQAGAQGPEVVTVQKALQRLGVYLRTGANGTFDGVTTKGVKDFQAWNGLQVTGTINRATAKRLGLLDGASTPNTTTTPATPPATSTNAYVGLKQGARGEKVKQLQRALQTTGLVVRGGADGIFGPATRTALVAFQKVNKFDQNGVLSARGAEILGLGTAPPPAPEPPSSSSPYLGLKVGAQGTLVRDLQKALIAAGVTVRGGADGAFGPATQSALRAYQKSVGIAESGVVDQATLDKLRLGSGQGPIPFANNDSGGSAPTTSNPYVGMKVGSSGDRVKELQRALQNTGLVVRGGADGAFGAATKRALIAFQSVNGIPQNGVVTEKGARILGLGSGGGSTNGAGSAVGYPVFGERSERVRLLQVALGKNGIVVPGGADGVFGGSTSGAIINFQRQRGLDVTGVIDQSTAVQLGLIPTAPPTPPSAAGIKLDVFPIQGPCFFGDTWHAPRGGGRLHKGTDIIADEGKELYAVVSGTITKLYWDYPGALAGNGLRLALDNGTYFTYLHLSGFAPEVEIGAKVNAGDVIGWNGNTGSSATAHLHFEIHPGGGGGINPYSILKSMGGC